MTETSILVVDDEARIVRFVGACLRHEGYKVVDASDGKQALRTAEEKLPDLIILDINMPKLDGFEVCREIRTWSQVPIIVLSGRSDETDVVTCLDLGADDYLTKPFSLDELKARVQAVLRRTKTTDVLPDEPTFASGELEINFAERLVRVAGNEIKLTPVEYNLLRQLVIYRGKVMTHRMLLQQVWGPEYADEMEYVRVYISRVRQKLGDDPGNAKYIKTESGVGYRFLTSS